MASTDIIGFVLVRHHDESPAYPSVPPSMSPHWEEGGVWVGVRHYNLGGMKALAPYLTFPDTILAEVLGCPITAW